MSRTSFRQARSKLTPRWLSEGEGGLVGYSLDLVKDAFAQRVYLGLLASMPETAPDDAIVKMGRDRRVIRGIFESKEAYVERLLRWLDDRRKQGTPLELLNKLAEYLGPNVKLRLVDNRGNWFTRNIDGTFTVLLKQENWDWDSAQIDDFDARWSRFWVIIYPHAGLWTTTVPDWGTGEWADGDTPSIGSTATREHVETVRAIVADWKPVRARCVNIIVAFDAASFDPASPEPDGTWHRASKNVAGVQVPARLDTARYWAGV